MEDDIDTRNRMLDFLEVAHITAYELDILWQIVRLAIVVYLLFSNRLFGLRGGGRAERAEYDADVGWPAIERATPQPFPAGPAPVYGRPEAGGAAGASSTSI